jgi:hypothetical protein
MIHHFRKVLFSVRGRCGGVVQHVAMEIGYCLAFVGAFLLAMPVARAQESAVWHDPSKHQVRFVIVENGVRLEVLDWGGSGRPVVLLAGLGFTAHVFDGFAEKLAKSCHEAKLPEAIKKPPAPSPTDLKSFPAYRDRRTRTQGVAIPEAELRIDFADHLDEHSFLSQANA